MTTRQFRLFGTIINDDSERWSLDDVTPSQFNAFLRTVQPDEDIELAINSPGGSVTAGLAIANMVKACPQPVTARVYGIAASMASVVACAAADLRMFRSSFMMIHNPWALMVGDSADLRKEADVLDSMKSACVDIYASKFPGVTPETLSSLMSDETWMLGSELSAYGLACTVEDDPAQMAACITGPARFAKIPEAAARFYHADPQMKKPAPPADDPAARLSDLQNQVSDLTASLEESNRRLAGLQSAKDKEILAVKADFDAFKATSSELHASELAALRSTHEAAITDFKAQLATLQTGLESARADLSAASAARETAEAALADTGKQLAEALAAHAALTGSVLKPSESFATWRQACDKLGYATARKEHPALYDAFMASQPASKRG